jgi:small subunit ribosomal protein S4
MGDPKKNRKIIHGPRHPWEADRIQAEKVLMREYGLKNKRELWKANSMLKKITTQSKKLIRDRGTSQAEIEAPLLLSKLTKMGLIQEESKLEDTLALTVKNILDRRLQSVFHNLKKSLTVKQARQFIIHGHVYVNGKQLTIPSYIVLSSDSIEIRPNSAIATDSHPEVTKLHQRLMGEEKILAAKVIKEEAEAAPKVEKAPVKEVKKSPVAAKPAEVKEAPKAETKTPEVKK